MFANHLIGSREKEHLLRKVVCSVESLSCSERQCDACASKVAHSFQELRPIVVKYWQWERVDVGPITSTKCIEVSN
jgi:hypothetical protein